MGGYITKNNRVIKLHKRRTFNQAEIQKLKNQPHIPASQMSAKQINDLKGKKQKMLLEK